MQLRFHPAALAELDEAVDYLEGEREGFGALFYDEIARRVAQAASFPKSGAPVSGFAARRDVRQFVSKRFRHLVITAVIGDERMVIAIAHASRDPRYWRDRVQ